MQSVSKKLEIDFLKSLTYTEINELFHQLNNKLSQASVFDLGLCPLYNRQVYIRTRLQIGGVKKWVCMLEYSSGWCLGKNGRWYFERNPSARTDAFISQTRFDTQNDAREAYSKHLSKGKVHKLKV